MKKTAGKKPDSVSSGGKLRHAKTHHIEGKREEDNIGNITVEEMCMVVSRSDDAKLWATVTVNGIPLRLGMDTGCPVSIINAECYGQFFQNITRRGSTLMLACYCDSNINVQGFFYAEVEYHGARKDLPLFVMDSTKHPLLGREWLKALAVDWNSALQLSSVSSIIPANNSAMLEQLRAKYADVFEDSIGRFSSVQANIRLKPNVKQVFLKARKIP